jgi:hypothetical protein
LVVIENAVDFLLGPVSELIETHSVTSSSSHVGVVIVNFSLVCDEVLESHLVVVLACENSTELAEVV